MTHRSTHPHKIALKDSEGRSDLTTLAYSPGKAEDQNIHIDNDNVGKGGKVM